MEDLWQAFVNVDSAGNITGDYSGKNIVAEDPYDFFFLVYKEVAMNLNEYRVQLDGFKPSLVPKQSAE